MKILTFSICAFVALSCSKTPENTESTKPVSEDLQLSATQLKNIELAFGSIQKLPIEEDITVSGVCDVPPENFVSVSVPLSGTVKVLTHNVLPGAFVKKGGFLAQIQSFEFIQIQQAFLQAFYEGQSLEREWERQKSLAADDISAKKKYQNAETELKINQSKVASLTAQLNLLSIDSEQIKKTGIKSLLTVYSPINAFVKDTYVNVGKSVQANSPLFDLISKEHAHIELKVLQADAPKVTDNLPVTISDTRIWPQPITGKVFLTGKHLDVDSKTMNVHVHLDNEAAERKLMPNMYITAKIHTGKHMVDALPESSFGIEDGKNFVFIKTSSNVFKKVYVETGATHQGIVEIKNPVAELMKYPIVTQGSVQLSGITVGDE